MKRIGTARQYLRWIRRWLPGCERNQIFWDVEPVRPSKGVAYIPMGNQVYLVSCLFNLLGSSCLSWKLENLVNFVWPLMPTLWGIRRYLLLHLNYCLYFSNHGQRHKDPAVPHPAPSILFSSLTKVIRKLCGGEAESLPRFRRANFLVTPFIDFLDIRKLMTSTTHIWQQFPNLYPVITMPRTLPWHTDSDGRRKMRLRKNKWNQSELSNTMTITLLPERIWN